MREAVRRGETRRTQTGAGSLWLPAPHLHSPWSLLDGGFGHRHCLVHSCMFQVTPVWDGWNFTFCTLLA